MNVPSVTVPASHPVPLVVASPRGHRPCLAVERAVTRVEIPGADPGSFKPISVNHGMFAVDALLRGGRLWQPVTHVPEKGADRGFPVPAPLETALRGLMHDGPAAECPVGGLADRPFHAVLNPSLRYAGGRSLQGPVPPAAMEAGLARGRAAVAEYAASDLLQDGEHLYRAIPLPLMYPGPVPRIGNVTICMALSAPGVLTSRIERVNYGMPHVPNYYEFSYISLVRDYVERLEGSVRGVSGRDEDVVEFANDVAPGLILMLRTYAKVDPSLIAREAGLWELAAAGSVRGIRGDALAPAVEVLRSAATALLPHAGAGHERTLSAIVGFADKVAGPALRHRLTLHEADAESLGALTP